MDSLRPIPARLNLTELDLINDRDQLLKLHQSIFLLKGDFLCRLTLFFILIILIFTYPALGEDQVKKRWANQTELTLIQTKGNSEVETFQFKNKLTNNYTETFQSELKLDSFYSSDEEATTAERYSAEGRMNYKLGSKFSAALNLGWKRDVFKGVYNRYSVGPILTYRFIDGPNHFFKTEANLDYVFEEYTQETEDDFLSTGLLAAYEWVLSDKVKFAQSVKAVRDFKRKESYQIESITALITKLNTYFSIKTGYQINHDTDPVSKDEELEKTDTILTVALVADF
jgi:putative salt-induced outer membrane protein YdiY